MYCFHTIKTISLKSFLYWLPFFSSWQFHNYLNQRANRRAHSFLHLLDISPKLSEIRDSPIPLPGLSCNSGQVGPMLHVMVNICTPVNAVCDMNKVMIKVKYYYCTVTTISLSMHSDTKQVWYCITEMNFIMIVLATRGEAECGWRGEAERSP